MSIDFQVVFPQQLIQLSSVTVVAGSKPITLDIIGQDFRSVDEVLINEIPSPNIVVLSRTRLLAQLPTSLQQNFSLMQVTVISRKLTLSAQSLIKFQVGPTPSKVRGILRLVQLFLKILFTTPGTDIFSPRIGAAALKNIGMNFGRDDGGTLTSDFIIAVDTTSRQIISIQGSDSAIPRDERLLAARVLSATFNSNESALIVSVELTSQAGQVAQANLIA